MLKKVKRATAFITAVLLLLCSLPYPVAAETLKEDIPVLSFENPEEEYVFGEKEGVCSCQQAVNLNADDKGNIVYELEKTEPGIEIDRESGIVSIKDYEELYNRLKNSNMHIKVNAVKEACGEYGEGRASYELVIKLNTVPEDSYIVSEPDGKNGWYRNSVTVRAEEGYMLKENLSDEEKKELIFNRDGTREEVFFVVNTHTGQIYREEHISVKTDRKAVHKEQMIMEFPEKNITEKLGIKMGFFNDFVKVRIGVNKEAFIDESDILSIKWKYEEYEGIITDFNENADCYYADIKIIGKEENIKGNVSFTVTDQAGNESSELKSEEILVLDKVSPVIDIWEKEIGTKGETDICIDLTEQNFYMEDVKIRAFKDNEEMEDPCITWESEGDIHKGKLQLNEDGKYDIHISYEGDPAGNPCIMKDGSLFKGYINHSVLIDKTAPVLRFDYGESVYFNNRISGKLYVKEKNFISSDVVFKAVNEEGRVLIPEILWEKQDEDMYAGLFEIDDEGEYVLHATYTDIKGNQSDTITSPVLVIDKTVPEININYVNTDIKNTAGGRKYFNKEQRAEITINEKNFNEELVSFNVFCCDSEGKEVKCENETVWEHNKDSHKAVIDFKEGNYIFSVTCKDLAGNTLYSDEEYFTVDKTAPENLHLTYSRSESESKGTAYYKDNVKVTIYSEDIWSGTDYFVLKFNDKETILKGEGISESQADIRIPEDILKEGNGVRGSIRFYAVDMAGNRSDILSDGRILVVDNICPELKVTYEEPVNIHNGINYYNRGTCAVLDVKEENFFPEDINVSVNMDGNIYSPDINWKKKSNGEYEGSISFSDDACYVLTVSYTDRSSNIMNSYASEKIVVDTEIQKPCISVKNLLPSVSFSDRNIESSDVSLFFTDAEGKNTDVTSDFIKSKKINMVSFSGFPSEKKYDGIYTLTAEMKDYAGNKSTNQKIFKVNRSGSVYSYGTYLGNLIKPGNNFVKSIKEDLNICELNPENTRDENIIVTKDARAYDNVKWSMKKSGGENIWCRNDYTVSKDSFCEDGIYRISLFSSDASGNSNENSENTDIVFTVDNTPPEIIFVKGLEEHIINASEKLVEYRAFDAAGIESVKVLINDSEVFCEEEIEKTEFDGKFLVGESFGRQNISIEVADMAGNVYKYEDNVIVSTNAFARFVADKKKKILTAGIGVIGILSVFVIKKIKKTNTHLH